jgi:hypothetical protein
MSTISPALTLLEIDDYDEIKMAERLYVNVREAMAKLKIQWKTVDEAKIIYLIKYCIVREINMIDGRKNAREYREKEPDWAEIERTYD